MNELYLAEIHVDDSTPDHIRKAVNALVAYINTDLQWVEKCGSAKRKYGEDVAVFRMVVPAGNNTEMLSTKP